MKIGSASTAPGQVMSARGEEHERSVRCGARGHALPGGDQRDAGKRQHDPDAWTRRSRSPSTPRASSTVVTGKSAPTTDTTLSAPSVWATPYRPVALTSSTPAPGTSRAVRPCGSARAPDQQDGRQHRNADDAHKDQQPRDARVGRRIGQREVAAEAERRQERQPDAAARAARVLVRSSSAVASSEARMTPSIVTTRPVAASAKRVAARPGRPRAAARPHSPRSARRCSSSRSRAPGERREHADPADAGGRAEYRIASLSGSGSRVISSATTTSASPTPSTISITPITEARFVTRPPAKSAEPQQTEARRERAIASAAGSV